jgi:predicted DNA binding CopG/RHH family protein
MVSLNSEEKDLLNSVEKGEWQSIENLSEEIKRYQRYANNQINKNKIEIFLSTEDTEKIQELATKLGQSIPNLSQEILHKYLQGELIAKHNN